MWTTASCWRPIMSRPTATPHPPRSTCLVTLACCRSACGPLPGRPRQPAAGLSNRTGRHAAGGRIPGPARLQFETVDIANMIMTTTFSHRLSPLILGCAAALLMIGCGSPLHAHTFAVLRNAEPTINYDSDQRSNLGLLDTLKPTHRQQAATQC